MLDPFLLQMIGPRLGAVQETRLAATFPGFERFNISVAKPGISQTLGVGQSTNRTRALAAAIGETLERQGAAHLPHLSPLIRAPYSEMKARYPVLSLQDMRRFSHEQTRGPGIQFKNIEDSDVIDWVRGERLTEAGRHEIYYPLARLALDYPRNLQFGGTTSSGFALAGNFELALQRALCEILERDAFLTAWWLKDAPPVYDFADLKEARVAGDLIFRLKERLFVLDLTGSWGVPAFAALIFGRTDHDEPALVVGGGAGNIAAVAVSRAIEESARIFIMTLQNKRKNLIQPLPPYDQSINTFSDIADLYAFSDLADQAKFLLSGSRPGYGGMRARLDKPPLTSVSAQVFRRGARILAFDMTPIDLHLAGLSLAAVAIPEAIPINAGHAMRPWGCLKLRDYSVSELNPLPHPFT